MIAATHALAALVFYRPRPALSFPSATRLSQALPLASMRASRDGLSPRGMKHGRARMPNEGGALWSYVASLSMDDLMSLLAHCTSLSLNLVQRRGDQSRANALDHAGTLAHAMPHDMTGYWQPTVANYLGRVSKERILEAVRESAGDDAARQIAGPKKQAMAERAEQLLAGKGWLPPLLRSVTVAEQTPA